MLPAVHLHTKQNGVRCCLMNQCALLTRSCYVHCICIVSRKLVKLVSICCVVRCASNSILCSMHVPRSTSSGTSSASTLKCATMSLTSLLCCTSPMCCKSNKESKLNKGHLILNTSRTCAYATSYLTGQQPLHSMWHSLDNTSLEARYHNSNTYGPEQLVSSCTASKPCSAGMLLV